MDESTRLRLAALQPTLLSFYGSAEVEWACYLFGCCRLGLLTTRLGLAGLAIESAEVG